MENGTGERPGLKGMIGWLKTVQGMLATFVAALAIVATWVAAGGFSWYLFGPNRLQHDPTARWGNGSWGYIVGSYDKETGPSSQRLHLNDIRVRADER
jgi:hypothetical protein